MQVEGKIYTSYDESNEGSKTDRPKTRRWNSIFVPRERKD
jgi:hypothetical protein